jgi:hypothetical protein
MQELPEDFEKPPAEQGKEYVVFYLTVTEIKDVHITDMLGSAKNRPTLFVESGKEYPAYTGRVTGVKFSDPTDIRSPSELEEGAQCVYVFLAPEGIQPIRLELTYSFKQDIEDDDAQSVNIEINLTESGGRGIDCQNDDGQKKHFKFTSPFTSQSLWIDGRMSPGEWADAFCIDLQHFQWGDFENGKMLRSRWWIQNDDQFIYYLARLSKETPIKGVAGAFFWPEYTGTWAHSDGFYINTTGYYQDHSNWDESDWHKDDELSPPGTVDVEAAVNDDGGFYWFEIKKALDSGDGYDWSLEPGQTIGGNPHDSLLFVIVMQDGDYWRNIQMELGER